MIRANDVPVRRVMLMNKATETRKHNQELREEKRRLSMKIRKLIVDTCIEVLDDSLSSRSERLRAAAILHELSKGNGGYGSTKVS